MDFRFKDIHIIIFTKEPQVKSGFVIISGNDKETEGYYVFEDGTEMEWLSFWINNEGASSDGIVISTMDAGDAGGWARKVTSYDTYPYICERDD